MCDRIGELGLQPLPLHATDSTRKNPDGVNPTKNKQSDFYTGKPMRFQTPANENINLPTVAF